MKKESYKAAYEREKCARQQAEDLLEKHSRELYYANKSLKAAYEELKSQKAQLVHSEKLASIGQLAAGVAHEINNPSAYVKSNIVTIKQYVGSIVGSFLELEQLVRSVHGKPNGCNLVDALNEIREKYDLEYVLEDVQESIADTLDGIDRIEDIVKSLKDFSRPDQKEPECFDINACIENTLKVAKNQTKYKADIVTNFSPLPEIYGQPGSMGQVFLNLLVNAAQAIDVYGKIEITTQQLDGYIHINIQDDGCGIEDENLLKVFDPFFTTKDVGAGTGLGLSISQSIIENHGGRIFMTSKVGQGTCFDISLPVAN